jgi:nucleoside-diphosphate-sugar epimerase
MKILVIGGTRFIGPAAAKHLEEAGHNIALFHRTYRPEIPYRQIQGDCEIVDELRNGIQAMQPDVIIHAAAMFERQIKALEQALSGKKTRVILLSSADVYKAFEVVNRLSDTPVQPVPIHERSPLRETLYPYRGRRLDMDIAHDYEKITVERAALESPIIDSVILRLGMVYGENDYNHRFLEPIRKMRRGDKAIELPRIMADFRACKCYVEDVAHGIRLAAEIGASGEVYNLAAQEVLSEIERDDVAPAGGRDGHPDTPPRAHPRLLPRIMMRRTSTPTRAAVFLSIDTALSCIPVRVFLRKNQIHTDKMHKRTIMNICIAMTRTPPRIQTSVKASETNI